MKNYLSIVAYTITSLACAFALFFGAELYFSVEHLFPNSFFLGHSSFWGWLGLSDISWIAILSFSAPILFFCSIALYKKAFAAQDTKESE